MKLRLTKLSWCGLLLLIIISFETFPQSDKSKKKHPNHPNQDCAGSCFSADVITAVKKDGGCTDYEMRVTHNGSCRYELSHFTVDIPCGKVSNISNSGGWANVVGKDPTTGLTGLKIDGIGNFGKCDPNFFTVKFTWCADSVCNPPSNCWQPRVAFKAATCVDYDTLSVSCTPSSLQADIEKQNISCFGKSDGSLFASVQGGVGPYTYSWSTGCTESSIHNLPTGTYTVTITDANGDVVTLTEEIIAPLQIVISATTVNPLCSGNANGSIDLNVEGGTGPYTFIWSNGATTEDLANITAGNYQVTVADSVGCSRAATFQLTNPQISLSFQLLQPACTQANGGVDITVSGGVEPYTYLWNTDDTTEDLSNAGAGSYNVVITDANGCTRHSTFVLRENNTLRISFSVTPTSCVDNTTGAIDITASGGTAPYTYLWTNGSTSEDLTGLGAGVQRVTVTDANGCTATSTINVFRQSFSVASQVTLPTCPGEANGSISLTPAGVPPYTFLWSTGETTSTISNLAKGTYTVTVTDSTGCSRLLNFSVPDPVMTITSSVSNLQCGAEGAFSIDLGVSGGTAPYTYLWSNGETTQDISGLNSGTYSVTITDSKGCSRIVEVVVDPVVINWSCLINPPTENPLCGSSGNPLGTSITGATKYAWSVQSDDAAWVISSGQNSPSIQFAAGGEGSTATFTLDITKDGCTQTCSFTLNGCSPLMSCGDGNSATAAPIIVADADTQKIVADTVTQVSVADTVTHAGVTDKGTPESAGDTGTQMGVIDAGNPGTVTDQGTQNVADENTVIESEDAASGQKLFSKTDFQLVAYPNPVVDQLNFGWTADADEYVQLEIVNMRGDRVVELYSGFVRQGESYRIEWPTADLRDPLYIYHYSSGTRTLHGKVLKRK